ncbi:hydroxymyristoyl-ACP dehydratase [Oleiagrimonas soli]|uniref:Hydroxymyristoyl-ACP dehydratase n=1 Tax=Oleiagrimonas soli TaxID=1543381 RepID=A0A099CT07_9GAMM|nr:hydroxymyristoyl-ACP dehydratase [Oleiagrimonas soli]
MGADHPALPGHFPGRPLVPGVVLLDELAALLQRERGWRLARIVDAKFVAPLWPDRTAELRVHGEPPRLRFEILGEGGVLARGRVEVAA